MEKEALNIKEPQITQITQIKKNFMICILRCFLKKICKKTRNRKIVAQKNPRNLRNLWFQSIVSEANLVQNEHIT